MWNKKVTCGAFDKKLCEALLRSAKTGRREERGAIVSFETSTPQIKEGRVVGQLVHNEHRCWGSCYGRGC